ncbi:ASCH/PUA domain-containing protein [Limibacter armeniacum]|uniref:ASCH/PUA domain-containing protein n=1 Tax=Limibacter armeniacum TaxID=466084 RepID=UPI002FE5A09B
MNCESCSHFRIKTDDYGLCENPKNKVKMMSLPLLERLVRSPEKAKEIQASLMFPADFSCKHYEQVQVHTLKILPQYFDEVESGKKTFEIRKDDRNGFKVGDLLRLMEWNSDISDFTGRRIDTRINYIFKDFGLQDGYVVMSISLINNL